MDQRYRNLSYQTLALAGVFQATGQVHELATRGATDDDATRASLESVLNLDAKTPEAVFGGSGRPDYGLRVIARLFSGHREGLQALQYTVAILQLERRFRRQADRQQALGRELELIAGTIDTREDGVLDAAVISQLANAWMEHVRDIEPRIVVNGRPLYLQNSSIVHQIRALLLAALRSAWLWRQVGGKRWALLLRRRAIAERAEAWLAA